ncbi:GNAT family N-acetyltransferase [Proteiniborus sp. MB09-C3]|uniref:GNAT family N-acetyltransferase n=1 Tax=Proteiniborus sp. MB09-C3 TaxID=3050072 RepID=UPI00255215DC|nr:GNAT family N-acetyltransferase [Proteiniborus sp. MB09-C3]WIV12461.1 GNAT family N-acetyltransferase [Proteiniborus sp. MB09-C3]
MEVRVVLANEENANIIKNIYPLYLHDLSEVYGNVPNEYGIYEDESIKTLAEQYDVQNIWFQKPNLLFPFIIMVDGKPAGFDLVSTGEYAPKGMDYYVYEFFLLRPYRGKDIASIAAKQIFDKFLGKWGLYVAPSGTNLRAEKFWRKTINDYAKGKFEEKNGQTFDGYKLIFTFDNTQI